jgi:hypothetical protein
MNSGLSELGAFALVSGNPRRRPCAMLGSMRSLNRHYGLLLLLAAAAAACTPVPTDVRLIEVDSSHGTLRFRGTIERLDFGSEIEFRPHIEATFDPEAAVNRTPVAELRRYSLTATSLERGDQGVEVLYRDDRSIELTLSGAGETGPLPVVSLRVPREVATEAAALGLSVSDGGILWRISDLD